LIDCTALLKSSFIQATLSTFQGKLPWAHASHQRASSHGVASALTTLNRWAFRDVVSSGYFAAFFVTALRLQHAELVQRIQKPQEILHFASLRDRKLFMEQIPRFAASLGLPKSTPMWKLPSLSAADIRKLVGNAVPVIEDVHSAQTLLLQGLQPTNSPAINITSHSELSAFVNNAALKPDCQFAIVRSPFSDKSLEWMTVVFHARSRSLLVADANSGASQMPCLVAGLDFLGIVNQFQSFPRHRLWELSQLDAIRQLLLALDPSCNEYWRLWPRCFATSLGVQFAALRSSDPDMSMQARPGLCALVRRDLQLPQAHSDETSRIEQLPALFRNSVSDETLQMFNETALFNAVCAQFEEIRNSLRSGPITLPSSQAYSSDCVQPIIAAIERYIILTDSKTRSKTWASEALAFVEKAVNQVRDEFWKESSAVLNSSSSSSSSSALCTSSKSVPMDVDSD